MPFAKRKADDLPNGVPSTNRPRTRSTTIAETQSTKKRDRSSLGQVGHPVSKTPPNSTYINEPSAQTKQNDCDRPDGFTGSEPGILGASSKATTGRATSSAVRKGIPRGRGQIMDAVVITIPRSDDRLPRIFSATGSLSPCRPTRHPARTSPLTPSKKAETTQQGPQRPPVSVVVLPTSSVPSTPLPNKTSASHTAPRPGQILATQHLPRPLPSNLFHHFHSQKHAVLHALQRPPSLADNDSTPSSAFSQLTELLNGTIERNEGNSCVVLGPRGSGKSRLVDRVLKSLPSTSARRRVVVRLSACCQTNDRLAMREIARQVHRQIGSEKSLSLLSRDEEQEGSVETDDGETRIDLLPPSHLPALISALPALSCPVVVVLDGFDGFAAHARQALLYCLLDTVQSCRGGSPSMKIDHEVADLSIHSGSLEEDESREDSIVQRDKQETDKEMAFGSEHGLLVIGITSRVDCLNLLEKRVKSRFSHRVLRVGVPSNLDDFLRFAEGVLCVDVEGGGNDAEEWKRLWAVSVNRFLGDKAVLDILKETFAFVKDLRVLFRLLTSPVIALTPSSPWLLASQLIASVATQRCPRRFKFLPMLPYPHIALLIAVTHTRSSGHDTFNFEMLYDTFTTHSRVSAAAPVQIEGGAIGMVKVGRGVMVGAFEHLVATHVFQPVVAPATHVTKEFVKYRCVAERADIKSAVEHLGQTNLKKWFWKAQ